MVGPRHQPGGLCLLLLLLCQFMEDRSAQGKRGGMRWEARLRQGFVLFCRLHWVCSKQRCSRKMLDQLGDSRMERSGKTEGSDTSGLPAELRSAVIL